MSGKSYSKLLMALDLQVQCFNMFQHFIGKVDIGVGQLMALFLGLDGNWVCQPVRFHLPWQALPALPHISYPLQQAVRNMGSSLALIPLWTAHP